MEKIFGLLGRTLGHSWSAPIHEALGVIGRYEMIEREPEELAEFLARQDLGGINVTMPYKKAVMPYCDVVDGEARRIGSVNTLCRREDGKLYAWNTDAAGFLAIARRAGIEFRDKKVLVLGTGGASVMVQTVARGEGARQVTVVSRSGPDNYENLSRHADTDIVVNATPVGMYPHNGAAPVDLRDFPRCTGLLELIYNPVRTALMMQAEELGIPCCSGLPMLVAQAVRAEEHFFGRAFPDGETERVLRLVARDSTNIVLVGMPGCGKTTVGQALAALTGREAIDIDRCVEIRTGCTVPDIITRDGEAAFRRLEAEETAAAGKLAGKIILTGGGAVKTPANYGALHQNGRIYHLVRDLDRLPTRGRPLSQTTDLRAMWAERAPLYARFRDAVTDNNGTPQEAAAAIWEDFCEHSCD